MAHGCGYSTPCPGYHQLAVALSSQEKLAFQGPDAIKWTYTIMPFGQTNSLATFINFIYNVDSQWMAQAALSRVQINEDTNTRIIIDDIVSYGIDLDTSLNYMECQLCICLAYCLSLSLKKSLIYPKRFEFVGNDVCEEGDCPAQSKHHLLSTWPKPELVRDIAKFIGFMQFYSMYIYHFKLRITPLHKLTINHEYTKPVTPIWTDAAQQALDDLKGAILSDSCLIAISLLLNLGAARQGRSVLFSDEQKLLFEGWKKGFVMNPKLDFIRR
jgi:hypothetical protein